jgi:UDP-N-acetyl-D-glucosamine dehydrogenase
VTSVTTKETVMDVTTRVLPQELEHLHRRFTERRAIIGTVGLGYVGLPLSLCAGEAGFQVIGFDIDVNRVHALSGGESPLRHISDARIRKVLSLGRFLPTADACRLAAADAILICVPTPLGPHREPDLSFVEGTVRAIAEVLRPGQLVVLESTTYPGTTRDVVKPILEGTGLRSGKDFFLAYSPERKIPAIATLRRRRSPRW